MRVNELRNVFCRMGVGRDNRTTWRILFIFVYLRLNIKNDYSFSFISWFYNDVCTSNELLEGFSLMFGEVVPIF